MHFVMSVARAFVRRKDTPLYHWDLHYAFINNNIINLYCMITFIMCLIIWCSIIYVSLFCRFVEIFVEFI